jgi:hypothetical protein
MKTTVTYEQDSPKCRVYGTRTEDGTLIKIWVPFAVAGKGKDYPPSYEVIVKGLGKKGGEAG